MEEEIEVPPKEESFEAFDTSGMGKLHDAVGQADKENDPEYDPAAEKSESDKREEKIKQQKHDMMVFEKIQADIVGFLGYYEGAIQGFSHSRFVMTEADKNMIAFQFVPIVKKKFPDGILNSEFMEKWGCEVSAAIGLFFLSRMTLGQLKTLKAEDAKEKKQREQEQKKKADAARTQAGPIQNASIRGMGEGEHAAN